MRLLEIATKDHGSVWIPKDIIIWGMSDGCIVVRSLDRWVILVVEQGTKLVDLINAIEGDIGFKVNRVYLDYSAGSPITAIEAVKKVMERDALHR